MALQIEPFRAKFDGMNTTQKKQFILILKNALENKYNAECKAFLNECIRKYNSDVQENTSNVTPKTTSQISATGKKAAGRAASQISSAGKNAASKIAPMASSARKAGKEAFNRAAGSSLVEKVANNESVSKIVDSRVMSKVSKNKNKRVLLIAGALAVVFFVIIVGSISHDWVDGSASGGSGRADSGNASKRDFSSREKIKAFFEENLERNYPDALKRAVEVTASSANLRYDGNSTEGYIVRTVVVSREAMESFDYFAALDGRLFDYSDAPNLRLLG